MVPRRPSTATSPGVTSSFSLDVNIPSALATITKPTLDALTFWADDIAQCLFGDGEGTSASYASGRSRDPSLIGSRFFTKRTVSTESSESGAEGRRSEVVAKLSIAKGKQLYESWRPSPDGIAILSPFKIVCAPERPRWTGAAAGCDRVRRRFFG